MAPHLVQQRDGNCLKELFPSEILSAHSELGFGFGWVGLGVSSPHRSLPYGWFVCRLRLLVNPRVGRVLLNR